MGLVYNAVAIQSNTFDCMYSPTDTPRYTRNLDHIGHMIDMAVLHSMDAPVKLVALCEGAIQGFPDEIHDWDPVAYSRKGAIDIPGPETERLSEKAVKWNTYIVAQAKARMPEFPDRFFNTMFVIDPDGRVVHQARKNVVFTIEHSTTPHDVYDEWVAMFGSGIDAFFPVARTPIGNIGSCICMDGNLPEIARGMALNGAEIIYRPSSAELKIAHGVWELQNRARAVDNACYVIAPNTGHHYIDDQMTQGFFTGGCSMIADYRGQLIGMNRNTGDAFISAPIHIDGLRQHRARATQYNYLAHLKTEVCRLIYQKTVWPPNLSRQGMPRRREAQDEIFLQTTRKLTEQGVFEPPEG